MGIAGKDRADGTADALLSGYLSCENGLLSCEKGEENKSSTIWDRALLYSFRALFFSGRGNRVLSKLLRYCEDRLTGERVPYAVEAYPEGGMRHLSGESALFCRMVTEGMLSMSPEGFDSFSFTPRLPDGLDRIYLDDIRAFGRSFSIRVDRDVWRVILDGTVIACGGTGDGRTRVSLN